MSIKTRLPGVWWCPIIRTSVNLWPPGHPHRKCGAVGSLGRLLSRSGEWRRGRLEGLNRANWDDRVPVHLELYDIDSFRAGGESLRPFEAA
jgi:hypothetical protein